jgi:hypothetical protein
MQIAIDNWSGRTREGENEAELVQSMRDEIDRSHAAALARVKLGAGHYAALAVLGVIAVVALVSQNWAFAILALAGGVGYYLYTDNSLKGQRQSIALHHSQLRESMPKILRAVLAEVVDWRREWASMDAVSAELRQLLDEISAAQFVRSSYSSARMVH